MFLLNFPPRLHRLLGMKVRRKTGRSDRHESADKKKPPRFWGGPAGAASAGTGSLQWVCDGGVVGLNPRTESRCASRLWTRAADLKLPVSTDAGSAGFHGVSWRDTAGWQTSSPSRRLGLEWRVWAGSGPSLVNRDAVWTCRLHPHPAKHGCQSRTSGGC